MSGPQSISCTYDDYAEELEDRLRRSYDLARRHLGEAAVRSKRYYDLRVRPQRYKACDWVYFYNPRKFAGQQDKWTRKFSNPYLVVKPLGPVNLLLQQSKRQRPFTVHIDKVKPFLADEIPRSWITTAEQDKRVGQLPPEEGAQSMEDGVDTTEQGLAEEQRGGVDTAIAGVPPEARRSPRPQRRAERPRRYLD